MAWKMAWKMGWRMVWRMGWRMVWRMVQSWVQDLAVSRCRELFWPSHDLPSQDNLELHVDGTPSPPEHTRPVPRETAKQLLPSCLFVSCVLWKHDVHRPTRVCLYTAQKTMRPHCTRFVGQMHLILLLKQLWGTLPLSLFVWTETKEESNLL